MTNSDRLDKATTDNSHMRKMALATIEGHMVRIIITSYLVYGFLLFLGVIAYSYNFNAGYQASATAIASTAITPFAGPVLLAINLLINYNHGIGKAKMLRKIKRHRFLITHLSGKTYYIEGIITRAQTQIQYGTSLCGKELKAFEQL